MIKIIKSGFKLMARIKSKLNFMWEDNVKDELDEVDELEDTGTEEDADVAGGDDEEEDGDDE